MAHSLSAPNDQQILGCECRVALVHDNRPPMTLAAYPCCPLTEEDPCRLITRRDYEAAQAWLKVQEMREFTLLIQTEMLTRQETDTECMAAYSSMGQCLQLGQDCVSGASVSRATNEACLQEQSSQKASTPPEHCQPLLTTETLFLMLVQTVFDANFCHTHTSVLVCTCIGRNRL